MSAQFLVMPNLDGLAELYDITNTHLTQQGIVIKHEKQSKLLNNPVVNHSFQAKTQENYKNTPRTY